MFVYIVILFGIAQLTYAGHNPLADFSSKYCRKSEDSSRNRVLSDSFSAYSPHRIQESRPHFSVSIESLTPHRGMQIPEAAIKKVQYAHYIMHTNMEVSAIKADIDRQLLQIRDMLRAEGSSYHCYEAVLHLESLATAFDAYHQGLQKQYQMSNQEPLLLHDLYAVQCLREELHNLINSIMVKFFDKDGAFLGKNPDAMLWNRFKHLFVYHKNVNDFIVSYSEQYQDGCIEIIHPVDSRLLELIKNNPFNRALGQVYIHLEQGNLDQANMICQQFASNKKQFKKLQKFKTASEHLNEYGILKVWESHPNWSVYKQGLIARSDRRSAIIQLLQHDHNKAYELCNHAVIDAPTAAQLNRAYRLGHYQSDPSFLDIAVQGLQDEAAFDRTMDLFEQRSNTWECIKEAVAQNPDSIILLKEHLNDLLSFDHDPQFIPIINEMVSNPEGISDLKNKLFYRDLYVKNMRRHLECFFFSEHAEQIAYQLSEVHSDYQRIEILGSLSIDHVDLNVQEAYQAFYDIKTHLPKLFDYEQQLLKIELPACFGTQEFTQERKLYAQIMIKPLTGHEQFLQAKQCVSFFNDACVPKENQAVYRDLARTAAQTYLHQRYNATPADRMQQIELFDRAYRAIEQGDITTVDIPVQSGQVTESLSKQAVHVDYQQLHENVLEKCETHKDGAFSGYYQSREHALKQMINGNSAIYKQAYELSPQAEKILEKNGFDLAQFTTCTGNLVQQDTHAKFVQTLNTLAQKPALTGATQQIKEGVLECAQAGSQLNQNGNVKEAMVLSDFCHVAVEYLWQGIDASVAISRGIADGVYVGASSEIAEVLRNTNVLQETFLTEGSWSEPDLRDRVAMETATIVADLVRLVKDAGEVVESGALGVGDAIVSFPELVTNCLEVTKVTGQCIGLITLKLAIILDDAERGDIEAIERNAQTLHNTCEQVSQGVNDYLAYLKECNRQCKGGTIKEDLKGVAYFIGRTATEGVILNGCAKILNGTAQYVQSTESALVQLQHMKDISKAQVRNVILSTQFNLASPTLKIPGTSAAIEQVVKRGALASEAMIPPSFSQAAQESIAKLIIQQGEASSSSSLAQKVGQYLSLEPKPGFILIPRKNQSTSDLQHYLVVDSGKIIFDLSKLDLNNIPIHLYDDSIGDLSRLQKLVDQLKDVPGAIGEDGPLQRVLTQGYKGAESGRLRAAKGAFYELEVAAKLESMGEKVIEFNIKYANDVTRREFDIVTCKKFIECKNIDWNIKDSYSENRMKTQFIDQRNIAQKHNKEYVIFSKNQVTLYWKDWFTAKNIAIIN